MSQVNSRKTKPKTKKKTKLSVRGQLSEYFDPSTLRTHKEKTLNFIGVGRFKDAKELVDIRKPWDEKRRVLNSKEPKSAACDSCGRVWRKENSKNGGILKTCPECRIRKEILSFMTYFVPSDRILR